VFGVVDDEEGVGPGQDVSAVPGLGHDVEVPAVAPLQPGVEFDRNVKRDGSQVVHRQPV
jgi:hypothetical protein